jgi:hypothetical protein
MKINKNILLLIISITSFLLNSCEDPIPVDYIPQVYVQGLLIVGEPIQNIILMRSQPVSDSFVYNNSLIRNADVWIIGDEREFHLKFRDTGTVGYYLDDESYLVKPNTKYTLKIIMPDSSVISGKTITPNEFAWLKKPYDEFFYPKDTLNPVPDDSLMIEWSKENSVLTYILCLKCLDTLNYGSYLRPPDSLDFNRRIYRPITNDSRYYEITSWAMLPTTRTPVSFLMFKWYGRHSVTIYAPDENYLKWFIQYIVKGQYDSQLNSIDGAIGMFGSATAIRDTFFLYKNK